jgi:hypothetical protein
MSPTSSSVTVQMLTTLPFVPLMRPGSWTFLLAAEEAQLNSQRYKRPRLRR